MPTAAGIPVTMRALVGAPHVFDRDITLADLIAPDPTPVAQACADSVAFLARHLLPDPRTREGHVGLLTAYNLRGER